MKREREAPSSPFVGLYDNDNKGLIATTTTYLYINITNHILARCLHMNSLYIPKQKRQGLLAAA